MKKIKLKWSINNINKVIIQIQKHFTLIEYTICFNRKIRSLDHCMNEKVAKY